MSFRTCSEHSERVSLGRYAKSSTPNGMQKSAMSELADCHPAKPRVAVRMSVTPELRYGIPYEHNTALRRWERFPLAGKSSQ